MNLSLKIYGIGKTLAYVLLTVLVVAKSAAQNAPSTLRVAEPVCEYAKNPIGIDARAPRLSWKLVSSQTNTGQTGYEIQVATNEAFDGGSILWKSGKTTSGQSVLVAYAGPSLKSGRRYYWQARVWDNHGNVSPWSETAYWETGLLNKEDWKADWIAPADTTGGRIGPVPQFRKKFSLNGDIKSARLYITSYGLYEAMFNGKRVSSDYFRPGWTSYNKRLQYQTYDVTSLLQKGDNAAGVSVGDGWYRGYLGFSGQKNVYGKEPALLFQLSVQYTDGKTEIITSDDSWKTSLSGPITRSELYNGERYDARLESDWTVANYTDTGWKAAVITARPKEALLAQVGPSVKKHETFKAGKVITTPKGETVIDFGQNLVGWVQFKISGAAGDSIVVQHAEVLDKAGNFYTDNLRAAKQLNTYILKGGGEESFEPHFTFQGFRYIHLKSFPGKVIPENITAVALYSDMPPTGNFATSDALLNQLQHNIQWGQKGNFLDVPTDCPQRDERLGWTGDAQVFFNTAAYNMQVASFFTKWLQDLAADQHEDGSVPVVIPDVLNRSNAASAGWSDVSTIIPWNLYRAYGDKNILETQYPSMKAWVDYIGSVAQNNLWNTGSHYGDWLFYLPNDDRDGRAAITDKHLIAQCFWAYSTQNLINAATVLGRQKDVAAYTPLLKKIKEAFVAEYLTKNGRLVSGSQTAYVLALNFDMLPAELRQSAADRLVLNIMSYGNHLTTGFLGTPYLCHVLSRYGYIDVAYKLLKQETYPSWLYPVKMGATTIWERWDGIKPDGSFQNTGMNSFNHYAYGAIGDWMYRFVAGISQDSASNGYKKIVVHPQLGGGLTQASGELETPYGKLRSSWTLAGGVLALDVVIPANTTATIVLPGVALSKVSDGQKELATGIRKSGNDAVISTGSGVYHYEYNYTPRPPVKVPNGKKDADFF